MSEARQCPNCGQPMQPVATWPGLWICPDYKTPTNNAPPFEFKCTGLDADDEAVKTFFEEIARMAQERN